jgi:hypothetical protein
VHLDPSMRFVSALAAFAALILAVPSAPFAAELKVAGKLEAPANTPVVAVSTDPVIQHVLSQDLQAAARSAGADVKTSLTLTVTVHQHLLKPGVSLADIAPGDPQVLALLRAAGASPLPIGDTGTERTDPFAVLARERALAPQGPAMHNLQDYQAQGQFMGMPGAPPYMPGSYPPASGPYSPYHSFSDGGGGSQIYDTAIVARAALSGHDEELTVVAVLHPVEDVRRAKKLVAEEIANAILH